MLEVLVTMLDGQSYTFEATGSTLVNRLKCQIQDAGGPPAAQLKIVFGPKVLEGDSQLAELEPSMQSPHLSLTALVVNRQWAVAFVNSSETLGFTGDLFSMRSFTVDTWVKIYAFNTGNQGDNAILGTRRFSEGQGLHLILRGGTPLLGFYYNDTAATRKVVLNRWTHLAFVYDLEMREQRIFIDGEVAGVGTGKEPLSGNLNVMIGDWAFGGRYLNGEMLRLNVWSFARPAAEITADFRDGFNWSCVDSEGLVVSRSWLQEEGIGYVCDACSGPKQQVGGVVEVTEHPP
eukprot:TRINITY_DN27997_c0_g1_i1.p1 TRINITY_DN27997_c0_g1~~TRINITY_DN27997_c0_g1_i1.p1  ORF type:complete len:340 (-),score=44.28 TRINITY_DN27997_c0_g1_i1:12-881(-)